MTGRAIERPEETTCSVWWAFIRFCDVNLSVSNEDCDNSECRSGHAVHVRNGGGGSLSLIDIQVCVTAFSDFTVYC